MEAIEESFTDLESDMAAELKEERAVVPAVDIFVVDELSPSMVVVLAELDVALSDLSEKETADGETVVSLYCEIRVDCFELITVPEDSSVDEVLAISECAVAVEVDARLSIFDERDVEAIKLTSELFPLSDEVATRVDATLSTAVDEDGTSTEAVLSVIHVEEEYADKVLSTMFEDEVMISIELLLSSTGVDDDAIGVESEGDAELSDGQLRS